MGTYEFESRFEYRDFKGSRLRCLAMTSASREQVAEVLTTITASAAEVTPDDYWMPDGFSRPEEAQIGKSERFLAQQTQQNLIKWWLAHSRGAKLPTWDIASTCKVDGKPGLLLMEAKAHEGELKSVSKAAPGASDASQANHEQIGTAIRQANDALNRIMPGWSLDRDVHYQLSNRFAWCWMIASLGVPVVLVYLGFLNALEMPSNIFKEDCDWQRYVKSKLTGVVPEQTWGSVLNIPSDLSGRTPFLPLISSVQVQFRSTPNL